ncbi:MAG: tRNA pseudouridine55 synthase [Variibacter sp.]|jgi:tRNA pseudouridine55 synthase|nr:tRNA pseudouridine55 synthase [Variibacter sp.]
MTNRPETAPQTDASVSEHGLRRDQRKREKRDVSGWLVLDKPVGMTSTHAVAIVKRAFAAKKAGHAGTLDPLASGVLPIALGEATKTVPFVMEGRKTYRFTVRWGVETDTDDAEGRAIATSELRPGEPAICEALSAYVGTVMQVPPRYSAIKIAGERAYDLAREGEEVVLEARPVEIERLDFLRSPDADHAEFSAACGKGTYVRAIARDLGRALGTYGHVVALRRTSVGPFTEAIAVTLDALPTAEKTDIAHPACASSLHPVDAALSALPQVSVSLADAARLARGQVALLRGRDAPIVNGVVSVLAQGRLVALADAEGGELRPRRIFNIREARPNAA